MTKQELISKVMNLADDVIITENNFYELLFIDDEIKELIDNIDLNKTYIEVDINDL